LGYNLKGVSGERGRLETVTPPSLQTTISSKKRKEIETPYGWALALRTGGRGERGKVNIQRTFGLEESRQAFKKGRVPSPEPSIRVIKRKGKTGRPKDKRHTSVLPNGQSSDQK